MRLQGMKTRLVLIVGFLLLTGMLLVNFVLIIFWQRDASRRELRHDEAVLAHLLSLLPADPVDLRNLSPDYFSFADFYHNGEAGQMILFVTDEKGLKPYTNPAGASQLLKGVDSEHVQYLLNDAAAESIETGHQVIHYSGVFPGFIHFRSHALIHAWPVLRQGEVVGTVAVVRSLESVFQTLWRVEKIVLLYILVNVMVLVVIGFFRLVKLVIRPIEQLVELADQYSEKDLVLFSADNSGSEFKVLSNSLNSMLTRIELDRESLERSVIELGTANQKLKSQQEEMIRTEKLASVGRMAAGLAHEIGNPLGVVQGYLGLLGQSGKLSDEHADFVRRAEQELVRVNILLRQMLDFARVSRGVPEKFALHELLQSVVEMVQVQSAFKGITLSFVAGAARDTVYADQDQLRQVLVNCLLNSADAVYSLASEQENSGCITVLTGQAIALDEEQSELISVVVSDNGAGVAEEDLSVIFDPFYTTKEPGKGTGLGLSVSLTIIESAGGRMEMKSRQGQGSSLTLLLPIQR